MKTNKKGFTLVELVIVIAVIAILAAVLLPTFAGIIARANENAAYQRARSTMDEVLGAEYYESLDDMSGMVFVITRDSGKYAYQVIGGGLVKILDKNTVVTGAAYGVKITTEGVVTADDDNTTLHEHYVVNTPSYSASYTGVTIYTLTVSATA